MSVNLHAGQSLIYKKLFLEQAIRFAAVCCARGWGKSYELAVMATTAIYELMELGSRVPNKQVAIIAPTYDQVKDIYYPILAYDLGLESLAVKSSRELGRFVFLDKDEMPSIFLRLLSYEAVERMRGKGYYFVGWDEICSCSKGISAKKAWEGIIQPTIITRWSRRRAALYGSRAPGRACVITTPKGYDFFYDMFHYYENDKDWGSWHFDYTQSPFIDPDEVERIRHTIDPIEFAREYTASFEDSGNSLFYMFNRKKHVRNDLEYFRSGETVNVGMDFNVGVQASSMFAIRGGQMHFLDEMKGHPDTETLANAIKEKYRGHRICVFPDPSGKARKTSAPVGRTDFSILKNAGFTVLSRNKAPPIIDSVAAVNAKLETAAGERSMFIHPKCVGLISSMERTKWVENNPDTATIDKKEGVEHFSDGVRYATEYLYPVRTGKKLTSRGFNF